MENLNSIEISKMTLDDAQEIILIIFGLMEY